MKKVYPPLFHFAAVYSNPCPAYGAPPLRHCVSASGHINTKTHVARSKDVEKHDPLPDLRAKWREWALYEGKHPLPRPVDLEV